MFTFCVLSNVSTLTCLSVKVFTTTFLLISHIYSKKTQYYYLSEHDITLVQYLLSKSPTGQQLVFTISLEMGEFDETVSDLISGGKHFDFCG